MKLQLKGYFKDARAAKPNADGTPSDKVYVEFYDTEGRQDLSFSTSTMTADQVLAVGDDKVTVVGDFSVFNWTPKDGGAARTFLSLENMVIKPVVAAPAPSPNGREKQPA